MLRWTVQEAAQGSNSNGNSSGAASSDIVEPQPDVNPIRSNPYPDPLTQSDSFDFIFDVLSPLPESMNFLKPAPGSVNLTQDQSGQSTQFNIDGAPIVGSTDLGPAQYTDPNNPCKCEPKCMDMGFTRCVYTEPLCSPKPTDQFDDLSDILDPLEQPSFTMFPPWGAYWWYNHLFSIAVAVAFYV